MFGLGENCPYCKKQGFKHKLKKKDFRLVAIGGTIKECPICHRTTITSNGNKNEREIVLHVPVEHE